jgi:hypothetical protein
MEFIKQQLNFRRHPKIKIIKEDYADAPIDERPNDIRVAIENLWAYCMEGSADGVLGTSKRKIELAAEWKGSRGKLIEILTNEETTFIDMDDEGIYHLHNWFRYYAHLKQNYKDALSEQKSNNAHAGWRKKELARLKANGVTVEECAWLDFNDKGRVIVHYEHLPKFMELGDEVFHTRAEFTERNKHQSKDVQKARRDIIKAHTKRCTCNKIFISSENKKCIKCRGVK